MNSHRRIGLAAAAFLVAGAGTPQAQVTGAVSLSGCSSIIPDNRAVGGELFAFKTLNAGGGPDHHMDWIFDVSAKGGFATTGASAGGPMFHIPDNFQRNTVPPEEFFVFMTYPGGYLAVDSAPVRGLPDDMGVVMRQRVGDSLPVGVDAGIGLVLPGDASSYTAGIRDHRTGGLAQFPYGTANGIVVAFSPIAEINTTEIGGTGCTVGGSVLDPVPGFGSIVGYNVFRMAGPPGVVPTAADFMGHWQYYIALNSFDLSIADTPGSSGPDRNGDGLPDGDGTAAPNDLLPNDLVGLQNPDGIPWSGDEVVIFQDSARNPDGTPRATGTAPILGGGPGYWYAFQPVVFQGSTVMTDYDGTGFTRDDEFLGNHSLDLDGDGIFESLDLDLDGTPEFYSPQLVSGQTGLGLTNGGVPLLSAPVFGRSNAAIALGDPRVAMSIAGNQVQIEIYAPMESAIIVGYEVSRLDGGRETPVTLGMIPARGGEDNTYVVTDALRHGSMRHAPHVSYMVTRVLAHEAEQTFGPFMIETEPTQRRRR